MINKCRVCGVEIAAGRYVCSNIRCVRTNFTHFQIRRYRNSRIDFAVYGLSGKQLHTVQIDEFEITS